MFCKASFDWSVELVSKRVWSENTFDSSSKNNVKDRVSPPDGFEEEEV